MDLPRQHRSVTSPVKLRRLEVEGGFLDGLDLTFSDGLNVLIGARGSGKTSVIELLRYCLRIDAVTADAQERAQTQALWVLEDGCATLTYEVDGVERVIRRGPNQDDDTQIPTEDIVFVSQKEIETVGDIGSSRRRILDDAIGQIALSNGDFVEIVERTARQLHQQRSELDDVVQQLASLADVPTELREIQKQQQTHQPESDELGVLQKQAGEVSDAIGELASESEGVNRALERIDRWVADLKASRSEEPDLSRIPKELEADVSESLAKARTDLDSGANHAREAAEKIREAYEKGRLKVNAKRRELADLNTRIEALEEGAGKISRALTALREQERRRGALEERRSEIESEVKELAKARSSALDRLSTELDTRFEARRKTAEELNGKFNDIKVDVIKAGEVSAYETALGSALEGSGLQWRSLAAQLSGRMSPRELVDAVEDLDAEAVANAAGISVNRAKRLVSHLATVDTTDIILASVEEEVEFSLLDGQEWKSTDRLSLGQRCTVVLPLLLARDPHLAVLDQPEDHLDNAFIVETVVEVLRSRRDGTQRLVATHNAYIPVLGDADMVFVMSSSGAHAFADRIGNLDSPDIVLAITELMEGGADAFKKRAEFYSQKL